MLKTLMKKASWLNARWEHCHAGKKKVSISQVHFEIMKSHVYVFTMLTGNWEGT